MAYTLYSWNTPNGQKVSIALEEAGADYRLIPVDISRGQQNSAEFRQRSPDAKIPVLVVPSQTPTVLFESGAILLYLARQFPTLHGSDEQDREQVVSWTFWQVGQLGPLIGQFGRFSGLSPVNDDAVSLLNTSVKRCFSVLETRLCDSVWLAGSRFTVADIASYPWVASPQSYLQRFSVEWRRDYPAVAAWADKITQRPAVLRALSSYLPD